MTEQDEQTISLTDDEETINLTDIVNIAKLERHIKFKWLNKFLADDKASSKSLPELIKQFFPIKMGYIGTNENYESIKGGSIGANVNHEAWMNVLRKWTGLQLSTYLPHRLKVYAFDDSLRKYSRIDVSINSALPKYHADCWINIDDFKEYLKYIKKNHRVRVPLPLLLFSDSPKKLTKPQEHRNKVRGVAKRLWKDNQNWTFTELIKHPDMIAAMKGQSESNTRNQIEGLNPNPKGGRRKGT